MPDCQYGFLPPVVRIVAFRFDAESSTRCYVTHIGIELLIGLWGRSRWIDSWARAQKMNTFIENAVYSITVAVAQNSVIANNTLVLNQTWPKRLYAISDFDKNTWPSDDDDDDDDDEGLKFKPIVSCVLRKIDHSLTQQVILDRKFNFNNLQTLYFNEKPRQHINFGGLVSAIHEYLHMYDGMLLQQKWVLTSHHQ